MNSRAGLGDTSEEAEALLLKRARAQSPAEKLRAACAMSRTVRILAETGVRSRHPGATEEQIRRCLAAVLLGEDLAKEVYGWDSERDGY